MTNIIKVKFTVYKFHSIIVINRERKKLDIKSIKSMNIFEPSLFIQIFPYIFISIFPTAGLIIISKWLLDEKKIKK